MGISGRTIALGFVVALAAGILVGGLLLAGTIGRLFGSDDGPPGRATLGGLSFAIPPGWFVSESEVPFSGGAIHGYLSTYAVEQVCGLPVDPTCATAQVPADQALIVFRTGALRGETVFELLDDADWAARVDGLPARLRREDEPAGGSSRLAWSIVSPGVVDQVVEIEASLAPDTGHLRAIVEAVLASVRFERRLAPLPAGPAADAVLGPAVERLVDDLDRDGREHFRSRYYACFPRSEGQAAATLEDGPGGPIGVSLAVVCAVDVAVADPLPYWRVTLAATWEEGPEWAAGEYAEAFYLDDTGALLGRANLTPDAGFPAVAPALPPELEGPFELDLPGVVEILEPGAQVWLGPDRTDALSTEPAGVHLYVLDGPVDVDGTPLYRVEWSPGRSHAPVFGWVAAVVDHRPVIAAVEPACPGVDEVTIGSLVDLIPAERLACFASGPIRLGPVEIERHEPDFVVGGEPAWLAAESELRAWGGRGIGDLEGSLRVHVPPGVDVPPDGWVELEGHHDDPAAAGCRRAFADAHAAELSPESPAEQELRCRERFVITSWSPVAAPG